MANSDDGVNRKLVLVLEEVGKVGKKTSLFRKVLLRVRTRVYKYILYIFYI